MQFKTSKAQKVVTPSPDGTAFWVMKRKLLTDVTDVDGALWVAKSGGGPVR